MLSLTKCQWNGPETTQQQKKKEIQQNILFKMLYYFLLPLASVNVLILERS